MREAAGMTQSQLAERARVSRQLVGAVEAGRHLPRVDAALALAAALGTDVLRLFGASWDTVDILSGSVPVEGSMVRASRVGDRVVTAPARVGPDGWDVADGTIADGALEEFEATTAGFVVAGCEPGLELVERILREHGMAAVSATASSSAAIEALEAGRVHAAVVHGPAGSGRELVADDVDRFGLTQWRVGLAAEPDAAAGWWQAAVSGQVPVVQREAGAAVQRAFEASLDEQRYVPGPRVSSHFESAQRAVLTGMPAVTIEPAALAAGASFHPIETHVVELWVDQAWGTDKAVVAALEVLTSPRFQRRLSAIGGYELSQCGTRAQ